MSKTTSRIETTNGQAEETREMATLPPIPEKLEIPLAAWAALAFQYRYRILAVLAVLAVGYYLWTRPSYPAYQPPLPYQSAAPAVATVQPAMYTPAAPALAAKPPVSARPIGGTSFVVAADGAAGSSKFLNSSANYKAGGGQTICLQKAAAGLDTRQLIGKTVTATGPTSSDKWGNQLTIVENPANLVVR